MFEVKQECQSQSASAFWPFRLAEQVGVGVVGYCSRGRIRRKGRMRDVLSIELQMPAMQAHDLQVLRTIILLYGRFWLVVTPENSSGLT